MSTHKKFEQSEIESIAKALGDTSDGLTGSEISHLLSLAKIEDIDSELTKWKRLHNAFCESQNSKGNRTHILEFIRCAMKPARYIGKEAAYETLRTKLNKALSFIGLTVKEDGELRTCEKSSTLSEAEAKACELKSILNERDIHQDVLKFCSAELLHNNYFHAVLEAVKSVFDKLRTLTGLSGDGHTLIDQCLSVKNPRMYINPCETESEKAEQRGFNELIKGIYSMFRSPAAHEAKINWNVTQRDAVDLLTMLSMIHRRIDNCKIMHKQN